jgi:hypothetical protein
MNQVHYLIDVNKIACGKVDRRTLPTFPQSLLILRSFIPKTGHLYFAEKGTFLLCLDRRPLDKGQLDPQNHTAAHLKAAVCPW